MDLGTTTLPGSSAVTTRVGFGCSNLLGDKTREAGLRLLETAYDCGIRHFDVARVYNFGDAEVILGEFAANKRHEITLTSKFGLMPREGVAKMKGPVQFVRRIMRSSARIRALVRRNVKSLTQAGQFDLATAEKSLHASLRALRTDYLDMYLMHECSASDCTPEMYDFLQRAMQAGKIRAYGCGTAFGRLLPITADHPEFLQVAQFESSLQESNVTAFRKVQPAATRLLITHGAMSAVQHLRRLCNSDPDVKTRVKDLLDVDVSAGSDLYGILLRYSLLENADGIVLFRASATDRIRSTLASLHRAQQLTADQFAELQRLVLSAPRTGAVASSGKR